jgi:hypothetical protein
VNPSHIGCDALALGVGDGGPVGAERDQASELAGLCGGAADRKDVEGPSTMTALATRSGGVSVGR